MKQLKTINDQDSWKINSNNITIFDNFFTPECLKILKDRVLFGKYFDKQYDSYAAIDYFKGEDYLSELIAKNLSDKIKLPSFQRAWSFIYKCNSKGVGIHCDNSVYNLNVWVSGESQKNKSKNGLNIYILKPPKTWKRPEWNGNYNNLTKKYIISQKIKPIKIPYKSNRAILFDGAYFHGTNEVSMKEGFENRRVSYTMLFGEQLQE